MGNVAFHSKLFANDKRNLLAEFVTSASSDSNFAGFFEIPKPCDIKELDFAQMKLTSTSCLVGGEVILPSAGVPLAYWGLQLVPTGPPNQAGVISVRTGRVLLTAAGIAEPVHFAKPFGLTWGEMLADGNLGQLYLDFNNWGQRFDGLNFNPHELVLSAYDPAVTDPYLGVSGPICFPFFGLHPLNIRDALATAPQRHVTVPKAPITPHAPPTELALSGTWHDVNSTTWRCSIASSRTSITTSPTSTASSARARGGSRSCTQTRSTSTSRSTVTPPTSTSTRPTPTTSTSACTPGSAASAQIAGCARIEGPTLERITVYGMLEQSAAAGSIFGPKAGYETEINIAVTPTTFDFYASGDMLLSAALVDLEASATAHLLVDFAIGLRRRGAVRPHRLRRRGRGAVRRRPAHLARRPGHAVPAGPAEGRRRSR